MRIGYLILTATVVSMLLLGCSHSVAPVSVPLVYRSSRMLDGPYQVIKTHVRVKVLDERIRKDAIGENLEHLKPLPVLTSDDPATYLKNVLTQQIQMRGGIISEDNPTREVVLHLVTFWTEESATYRSQVVARAEVLDARGKQLWEGMVGGKGSAWGRSLNPTNYQESISDATTTLIISLLGDAQAARALTE